jgi:two-component system response regulator AlgR
VSRLFIVDDEAPARLRLRTLLADCAEDDAEAAGWEIAGEAANGPDALAAIAALRPDVVLLDVHMPGMSGIEVAAELDAREHGPAVIFVTAYDDHALDAFAVHAFDYLVKPVRAERLCAALKRVLGLRRASAPSQARRQFSVPERDRVELVPVEDVLFIKANLKYVELHTARRMHLIEESLSSLEEELAERYVRVHRSALVARDAIAAVERAPGEEGEGWQVVVRGSAERLPISRRQWAAVKALVK